MTDHNKDMRQDRQDRPRDDGLNNQSDAANRANQQAASRPGVDADNALDERGAMTATPHAGSAYQPLRAGSDEDRQRDANSDYVLDQGAGTDDGEGVSRRGGVTQRGEPVAGGPRRRDEAGDTPRGSAGVQNHQGLHEPGPGEQIRERGDDEPRGMPGDAPRRP